MAEPEARDEKRDSKTAAQSLSVEDEDFPSLWRTRLRSRSPLLNFRGRSTRIVFQESDTSAHADERRPSPAETDERIPEPRVGGWMDSFLKQLPEAAPAVVFTASCLLLLPLILHRHS